MVTTTKTTRELEPGDIICGVLECDGDGPVVPVAEVARIENPKAITGTTVHYTTGEKEYCLIQARFEVLDMASYMDHAELYLL